MGLLASNIKWWHFPTAKLQQTNIRGTLLTRKVMFLSGTWFSFIFPRDWLVFSLCWGYNTSAPLAVVAMNLRRSKYRLYKKEAIEDSDLDQQSLAMFSFLHKHAQFYPHHDVISPNETSVSVHVHKRNTESIHWSITDLLESTLQTMAYSGILHHTSTELLIYTDVNIYQNDHFYKQWYDTALLN